ncbi:MAG: type III pantothenate kinase, partial [Treponema sp.]|nr:type III pantothenate kinase [Treponema sp.]
MLFAVDIGNTNIVAALFNGKDLRNQWRIASDSRRTGDEYSSVISTLIRDENIQAKDIDKAIISSVVPDLLGPFVTVSQRLTKKKPFVLSSALAFSGQLPVRLPEGSTHEL